MRESNVIDIGVKDSIGPRVSYCCSVTIRKSVIPMSNRRGESSI